MTEIIVEGRKVKVSDDFLSLPPDEQERTVEEIARSLGAAPAQPAAQRSGFMGQVNAGIADAVGGLVDFVNPFDAPVWGQYGLQTGSAREGMKQGMSSLGIDVAQGAPQGAMEGMARGAGLAAGSIIPASLVARIASVVPGAVGMMGRDAFASMATKTGTVAEIGAGAVSGGIAEGARSAGAPGWLADSLAVVAPIGAVAGGAALARGVGATAKALPLTGAAIRAGQATIKAMAPMTAAGAREVAKTRLRNLAGGEDRAAELGGMIDPQDALKRTPAQQTGDENMLGLEAAGAAESPVMRERLAARRAETGQAAVAGVQAGSGRIADTRAYFTARLTEVKDGMKSRLDRVMQMATEAVDAVGPRASETGNATALVGKIKTELDAALAREADLWNAVPRDARIATTKTQSAVDRIVKETPWAQRRDIPADLQAAFGPNGALGDATTVAELHGLYSEMRRVARSAMAGTDQNKNRARIANDIAEAILSDLGAIGGESPAGRAINEARVFSRALHETFDQGAVGRILRRTIDGDEAVTPEAALARTVGRGGSQGVADAAKIEAAAPDAAGEITDYLRGRFMDAVITPDGTFSPKRAAAFMRENRETLARYPGLVAEFRRALGSRNAAEAFAARTDARIKAAETGSTPARFNAGQEKDAIFAIIGADNPALAARSAVATARKDQSGKAVAGLKAAFSDYLIGKAGTEGGLSAAKLAGLLADRQFVAAARQVYSGEEWANIQKIASALTRMETKPASVGGVINEGGNALIDYIVRMQAARIGGQMGGGSMGGSLQTANIFTARARDMLGRLTNDKARQLLMDAIEDPALMRALLMEPKAIYASKPAQSKLAPYFVGGVSGAAAGQEPAAR